MRRPNPDVDPEQIRISLTDLLTNFGAELQGDDLRAKVVALIPVFHHLRDLGSSLLSGGMKLAARDRIIGYFLKYPRQVIDGDELMVVSGISEWARRLRELRVEFGWSIYSGLTFRDIAAEATGDDDLNDLSALFKVDLLRLKPDQYVLMRAEQDRDAAHRWNILNEIRRKKISVTEKLLEYFRRNVGDEITGEELRYLAKDKKEWARRVRELRTEKGWPISTKSSGREDLDIGVYVLEEDRQAYEHDRAIPDLVRIAVLQRDGFRCVECGWNRAMQAPEDPRKFLELHHRKHHKEKGQNTADNLVTLCNVHHDELHRSLSR